MTPPRNAPKSPSKGFTIDSPTDQQEQYLPVLRPDLQFFPGPQNKDGSPTFTLYDPLAGTYNKIGWATAEILKKMRVPKKMDELLHELHQSTTIRVNKEQVLSICKDIEEGRLTQSTLIMPVDALKEQVERKRVHPLKKILQSYLFFRVPLLHPDEFLERTVNMVKLLVSGWALFFYALISLIGVGMLLQQFQDYISTFPYFFNFSGMIIFSSVVVCVKVVHEFAHAYAAKSFGVRVPSMGVAFMVFWPVAYCDVTDAWRVAERKKRLIISGAGMFAELIMAGLALFAWGVSPGGLAKSIFFVISSTSLISTVLVNTNPAMRYDGYYLLMDLWGIDNLQTRAFAMTRWLYRKYLLGIDLIKPEPASKKRVAAMTVYSIGTWIYRFLLYMAIAAIVYYKFTKAIGILLFATEIVWFLVAPVARELKTVFEMRQYLRFDFRIILTFTCLLLLILWLALPLPRRFSVPAAVVSDAEQLLYVPHSGRIVSFASKRGDTVTSGDELIYVASDELYEELKILEVEKNLLEKKKELSTMSEKDKALAPQLQEQIQGINAQLAGLRGQLEQSRLSALESGTLFQWDPTLYNGRYVTKNEVLGKLANLSKVIVVAFVEEDRVADLAPGHKATFFLDAAPTPLSGKIRSISPVRAETMKHPALTSLAQGALPVIQQEQNLVMLESRYALEIELDTPDPTYRFGQSGRIWLHTPPRSRLVDFAKYAYRILVRESSF